LDQELKLLQLADDLGVRVEEDVGRLRPADMGGWFPDDRLILIRRGLGYRNRLHAIAHELGHATHDDPAGHVPRHELRAERYAAQLLIDPHEYAELETMYDGNPGAIAAELGVTVGLLTIWRDDLARDTHGWLYNDEREERQIPWDWPWGAEYLAQLQK